MLRHSGGISFTDFQELKSRNGDIVYICSFCGKTMKKEIDSIDDYQASYKAHCICPSAKEQIERHHRIVEIEDEISSLKEKQRALRDGFYSENEYFFDNRDVVRLSPL